MITALCYLPKGAASAAPVAAKVDDAELEAVRERLERAATGAGASSSGDDGGENEENDENADDGSSDEREEAARARAVASAVADASVTLPSGAAEVVMVTNADGREGEDPIAELDMEN